MTFKTIIQSIEKMCKVEALHIFEHVVTFDSLSATKEG